MTQERELERTQIAFDRWMERCENPWIYIVRHDDIEDRRVLLDMIRRIAPHSILAMPEGWEVEIIKHA